MSRVAKPGSNLLFQVNVYITESDLKLKTAEYARLHPQTFSPVEIIALLRENNFEIIKDFCSDEINDYGEHFFICAGRHV
jgi:hypothetical protein